MRFEAGQGIGEALAYYMQDIHDADVTAAVTELAKHNAWKAEHTYTPSAACARQACARLGDLGMLTKHGDAWCFSSLGMNSLRRRRSLGSPCYLAEGRAPMPPLQDATMYELVLELDRRGFQ